jgi:predicted dehydrogenase
MPDHLNDVWLVGAGAMAREYAKVLDGMRLGYEVIGRGHANAAAFREKTGHPAHAGGVEAFAQAARGPARAAIVAVGIADLAPVSHALLAHGVRRILTEKPAGLDAAEVAALARAAEQANAQVHVGYNRRFHASTRRAREIIAEDGGVTSFTFEFTEWSHEIEALPTAPAIKRNWLLANSSHVIDLAFFLGGAPAVLHAHVAGGLGWHPSAAVFTGSGVAVGGALFSYHANWAAPGRWGVEVMTRRRRLILRPLEKLQIQKLASVAITEEPLDDAIDRAYKPGLYRQVEAFLGDGSGLPTIAEQAAACAHHVTIGGG